MTTPLTVLSAEDQVWLHGLVMIHMPARVTPEAMAGHGCLWCQAPMDTSSIDLAPGVNQWRSCAVCYLARLASAMTWRDWHTHTEACATCLQPEDCMVARGRRAQHERTLAALGEALRCTARCRLTIGTGDPAVPIIWEGEAASYPGYAHVSCLARSGREV
ncbi:hypothetical protein [Streptomyces sp. NPDC051014]|uniref:hypothetical protein n=1 Tax=Streptomyces sp. NPDC051014 TaxID=3155751 RepID=UPI0033E6EF72